MSATRSNLSSSVISLLGAAAMGAAPAWAQGYNFGGVFGGIIQSAIQLDVQRRQIELQREQIELERRRLRIQEGASRRSVMPPAPADDRPDDGPPPYGAPSAVPQIAHDVRLYSIDGLTVGSPVWLPAKGFNCYPSEQFSGYRWCGQNKVEKGVAYQAAVLEDQNAVAAFYSKYYSAARFENGAIDDEIIRLSRRHREAAHILAMPRVEGVVRGVAATWGDLTLTPVDATIYGDLAGGRKVVSGLLVDFLGDVRDSARRGLPVYRIGGGPGYFWVARADADGEGILRFGIADASAYDRPKPPPAPAPLVAAAARPVAMPSVAVQPPQAWRTDAAEATAAPVRAGAPDGDRPPAPASPAPPVAPVVAVAPAATPQPAADRPDRDRRVALVIGNAAYRSVGALANPNGDAEAVTSTLRSLGFSVKLVEDGTLQQMKDAIRDFQAQADEADWAMVYYAGHGIEVSGQNYLIPVDARLRSDQDADDETVSLRYVLDKMHNARKLRLVVLDACRENPFQAAMKRNIAARAVVRGLAPYEPRVPSEMVVYAAKDGEQAQDGTDAGHSPFAKALVARMTMPGVEINKVFRLVTADVLADTHNQQQPFVYGSTPGTDDFFFKER